MTAQAFSKYDNSIIEDVMSIPELVKFKDYIFKALSCEISDEYTELVRCLCKVTVEKDKMILKQCLTIKELENVIDSQKLTINTLQTKIFGTQSEKAKTIEQDREPAERNISDVEAPENIVNSAESVAEKARAEGTSDKRNNLNKKQKKRKKNYKNHPKRKNLPVGLQRIRVTHIQTCNCSFCGKEFKELKNMYDISEELCIRIQFYVTEHARVKIAPTCKCAGNPRIYTSPKSGSVIPKGKHGTSLICFLLMNKFFMQLPLHRQCVKLFSSYNANICESTVLDNFRYLHQEVLPQFYNPIKAHTLDSNHFCADETSWKVFIEKEGRKTFNNWIWVVASKNAVSYVYDARRSQAVVLRIFSPDATGTINVDRYASYNALPEGIKRSFCWYHLRRDFIRLAKTFKSLRPWCTKWLKSIRAVEKLNSKRFEEYCKLEKDQPLSEKFEIYHKRLHKLLTAFHSRAIRQFESGNLDNQASKVLKSLFKHWHGYTTFYEFPFIPMHNNYAERLLRQIANARNNFLGSHSVWSAELMAMVLSICETSRLYGLNPYVYMEYILTECSKYEDRKIPDISSILPWNINVATLSEFNQTKDVALFESLAKQNTNVSQEEFQNDICHELKDSENSGTIQPGSDNFKINTATDEPLMNEQNISVVETPQSVPTIESQLLVSVPLIRNSIIASMSITMIFILSLLYTMFSDNAMTIFSYHDSVVLQTTANTQNVQEKILHLATVATEGFSDAKALLVSSFNIDTS